MIFRKDSSKSASQFIYDMIKRKQESQSTAASAPARTTLTFEVLWKICTETQFQYLSAKVNNMFKDSLLSKLD